MRKLSTLVLAAVTAMTIAGIPTTAYAATSQGAGCNGSVAYCNGYNQNFKNILSRLCSNNRQNGVNCENGVVYINGTNCGSFFGQLNSFNCNR